VTSTTCLTLTTWCLSITAALLQVPPHRWRPAQAAEHHAAARCPSGTGTGTQPPAQARAGAQHHAAAGSRRGGRGVGQLRDHPTGVACQGAPAGPGEHQVACIVHRPAVAVVHATCIAAGPGGAPGCWWHAAAQGLCCQRLYRYQYHWPLVVPHNVDMTNLWLFSSLAELRLSGCAIMWLWGLALCSAATGAAPLSR
jgi:hypothetical protein